MWAGWGPASSSAPVPVAVPVDPVPDDSVPEPVPDDSDPVPATGSGDDGNLSSVSSDHPYPPAPDPVPSYPSLTVDDIPTKRLSTQS